MLSTPNLAQPVVANSLPARNGTTQSFEYTFSVVVPVYGCAACLNELINRINATLQPLNKPFEIILINDASPDDSAQALHALANEFAHVRVVSFSRNFGQHAAITAGIDFATGEWVAVMDCDLQDQPEEIPKLYARALEGFDVVCARRHQRKDGMFKRFSSWIFWSAFDYLTDKKTDHTVGNFGLYNHRILENFRNLREHNRNFPLFIRWLGFRTTYVDVDHAQRAEGKSSYTFSKLLTLALDSMVSHSNRPLRISIKFGFLLAISAVMLGAYLIIRYLVHGVPVAGWTSVMVTLLLVSGMLFANLGMLGLYIGKIFDETKNRPIYVVGDTQNCCKNARHH
jgi:polyisoprenyl-phosphate glycosyltransferase